MTARAARDRLMHAVLVQLELASSASAAQLERTAHGKPGSIEPKWGEAPARRFRWQYRHADDDADRDEIIAKALAELRRIRYAQRPKVDMETREGRLQIGRDPRPASVVAYVYGYSIRHVRRLRALARAEDRR